MPLVDEITQEINSRGVYRAMEMVPKIAICIAGHALNLRQKGYDLRKDGTVGLIENPDPPMWTASREADLRNHLFIMAEPGLGKNFWWTQMFDPAIGVFTGILPSKRIGKVTEPALVGGKNQGREGFEWQEGAFKKYGSHVLFSPEFSSILNAGKQSHSANMITTLLEALDSGFVGTLQVGVDEEYYTRATAIFCTQPGRMESISGADRRFMFERLILATRHEREKFKRASAKYKNWRPSTDGIEGLRERIREKLASAKNIQTIRLDDNLNDWISNEDKIPVAMQGTIERALIAYWFLDAPEAEKDFVVPLEGYLREYGESLVRGRAQVNANAEAYKVISTNTEPRDALVVRVKNECSGIRSSTAAREEIEACLRAHPNLHVIRMSEGRKWFEVVTGLPIKDIMLKHGGKKFVGRYDADGEEIRRDE